MMVAKEKLGFTRTVTAVRMWAPLTSSLGVKLSAKNRGNVTPRSLCGSYTFTLKKKIQEQLSHKVGEKVQTNCVERLYGSVLGCFIILEHREPFSL